MKLRISQYEDGTQTTKVLGLAAMLTDGGTFAEGAAFAGETLTYRRAHTLTCTEARLDADGTWTLRGLASDADKAMILAALQATPQAEVDAALEAARAELAELIARHDERRRKIAAGEIPAPAPFRSKYSAATDDTDAIVDMQTDRLVRGILGL